MQHFKVLQRPWHVRSDARRCRGMVRPGSIEGLGLRVRSYRTEPAMSAFGNLPQHDNLSGHTVATTLSGSGSEFCDQLGRRFD
ncbi:hypothetical protein ABIA24_000193 [Sinorhizobium fredii]